MANDVVHSADGTTIAYETFGRAPALIVVCGATCDRALMRPTAQALGEHFTTVNYDRRGRGSSGDTLPYAVEREIEDLGTLLDRSGGSAHLYGHSSGAGLVLRAVAAGLPVNRFVLQVEDRLSGRGRVSRPHRRGTARRRTPGPADPEQPPSWRGR